MTANLSRLPSTPHRLDRSRPGSRDRTERRRRRTFSAWRSCQGLEDRAEQRGDAVRWGVTRIGQAEELVAGGDAQGRRGGGGSRLVRGEYALAVGGTEEEPEPGDVLAH